MAARKTLTVDWPGGVCIREMPSTDSKVLGILPYGEKVAVDQKADAPDGWTAVSGGGFTKSQYLK